MGERGKDKKMMLRTERVMSHEAQRGLLTGLRSVCWICFLRIVSLETDTFPYLWSMLLSAVADPTWDTITSNMLVSLSGMGVLVCLIISARMIIEHFRNREEALQEKMLIEGIIFMLPIYALCSFLALLLSEMEGKQHTIHLLEAIKEIYEAVTLQLFLELMFSYTSVTHTSVPADMVGRHVHFGIPLDWVMKGVTMDQALVYRLESWTLQFILFRPLQIGFDFAIHNGWIDLGMPWLTRVTFVLYGISSIFAVSSLVGFYHTFAEELAPYAPFEKFIAIKLLVFFTTYQRFLISPLIPFLGSKLQSECLFASSRCSKEVLVHQLSSVMVCLEVGFVFSFRFQEAFSIKWLHKLQGVNKGQKLPVHACAVSSSWSSSGVPMKVSPGKAKAA